MTKQLLLLYVVLLLLGYQVFAQQTGKWGDQGDGTFRNPIIAADFSDPDPIRVGEDYYMASSTFESVPGVSILHSTDLVNWEILGGVFNNLDKVDTAFTWAQMGRYNLGVYAPCIRYHDGKFWVFVNFFTDGFWVATAKNPEGPWNIRQVKDKNGKALRTKKWTDPCPFWDEDGKAYLTCSRPPGKYWYSYIFQMSPDGSQLFDADVNHMNTDEIIYEYPNGGTLISPHYSSEGNKIYKRNGFYYLVHIEFIGENPGTYIYRSRHIYGTKPDGSPGKPGDPGEYEKRRTDRSASELGGKYVQELPGQGGFVDTPDGRWFYISQFNRHGSDGRTPCLLPVTWIDDWPVIGDSINNGYGKMAWQLPKPISSSKIILPHGSDEFSSEKLSAFWAWNHQPRNNKWSLTERKGYLRLYGSGTSSGQDDFFKASNTINQRYMRSDTVMVTIKMDIAKMVLGQIAGLANFNGGRKYAFLAVSKDNKGKRIIYQTKGKYMEGPYLEPGKNELYFRSTAGFDDIQTYQYSTDGATFISFGESYKMTAGNFRGNMIGIFTYNNKDESGYVDVDWFKYEVSNKDISHRR